MKKSNFILLIRQQCDKLIKITQSKGEEYSRSSDDQLANFKRAAVDYGLSQEQVLGIFLDKHINSIKTYIHGTSAGEPMPPMSEPIEGRIDDAILYLLLFKAMVLDSKLPAGGINPPDTIVTTEERPLGGGSGGVDMMKVGSGGDDGRG